MLFKLRKCPVLAMQSSVQGGLLIQVNRNPIQEIGSKVGGGCSFVRLE